MSIALPEEAAISLDECYRCGYDLRGIADDQPCPECGLLAQRSRHLTDELHDTRPKWLASISRGTNLILLAIALTVMWLFGQRLLFTELILPRLMQLRSPRGVIPAWMQLLLQTFPYFGFELAALVLFLGVIFLTRREQYPPADRADRPMRVALRCISVLPLVCLVLHHVALDYYFSRMWRPGWRRLDWMDWLQTTALWLAAAAGIALPLLLFFRLRGLAKRARSAHLAEHCAIVGIGTSCSMLYLIGIAYILNNADRWGWGTNWSGRSRAALWLLVALVTAATLFTLWSLYLLIRFAVAFRRASRRLRQKWSRDDRANLPSGTSAATIL